MYRHNRIGPFPIIDPSVSIVNTYAETAVDFQIGSPACIRLDTANLGSKSEAYSRINSFGSATLAANYMRAMGVCLKPMEDITNEEKPIFLDVSMEAHLNIDAYEGRIGSLIPFVGFIDNASATLANSWDATHNLVTDYHMIPVPGNGFDSDLSVCTQILLKDIVSGGLDTDKFLCAGIIVSNTTAGALTLTYSEFQVSARYALGSISTAGTD